MTQSGVSQHIRKLESQLGVELLIRQGKQFQLSDAGERLYVDAQEILLSLSNLQQTVGDNPAYEGKVRLMSPGSVGLKLYPQLLSLQGQYPELIIEYRFAPNSDVEKAVANADVEMGLMTSKNTLAEVQCTPIGKEALQLVTPATVEKPRWEQLMSMGFIDHPDGSHHANLLLEANFSEYQHVKQFPQTGFSNQIGLILEPVSRGLGFTVLPAYAVAAFDRPDLIKSHSLPKPVSETLYLCLQRDKIVQNRVTTVIEEAKRCLK